MYFCIVFLLDIALISMIHVQHLLGWTFSIYSLKLFWAAARGGCSLLHTQAVWLHCKPGSSAGVSPFLSVRGNEQWETAEENTRWPRPKPCFRPLLGWAGFRSVLRAAQKRTEGQYLLPKYFHSWLIPGFVPIGSNICAYICIYINTHLSLILFVLSAEPDNDPSGYLIEEP